MKKYLSLFLVITLLLMPSSAYADVKDDRIAELEAQVAELQSIIEELQNKLALYEGRSIRDLSVAEDTTYILNTKSHKIHLINGADTDTIADKNRMETNKSLDELLSQGYTTCGRCFK